jgi:hypothetical protein
MGRYPGFGKPEDLPVAFRYGGFIMLSGERQRCLVTDCTSPSIRKLLVKQQKKL